MVVSGTTRTHLIYQFIILTLLFLSIGYNELLPGRKFVLFLAFIPIFCYQLAILSCCLELIPVPRWMGLLEFTSKKINPKPEELNSGSLTDAPVANLALSQTQSKKSLEFSEISEIPCQRRWEKSVTNIGASPKYLTFPPKAKSWMSLNDSKSAEKLNSREGSLDILTPLAERKCNSGIVNRVDKARNREERATKARSWKPSETNFQVSSKSERVKSNSLSIEPEEQSLANCAEVPQEESEFSKSYSFPFRQKRLESWLEMKETSMEESNESLDMPYWQTVGYNLAVKYEARRRRRATSNPSKSDFPCEESVHIERRLQTSTDSVQADRHHAKKTAKAATACINKIKVGFSNLISKKKDELSENNSDKHKMSKPNLLLKLKNKNISCSPKDKCSNILEFPQFLNNDRPLIFYPKYLPFEKERFESDVKKKMKELEQKTDCNI